MMRQNGWYNSIMRAQSQNLPAKSKDYAILRYIHTHTYTQTHIWKIDIIYKIFTYGK